MTAAQQLPQQEEPDLQRIWPKGAAVLHQLLLRFGDLWTLASTSAIGLPGRQPFGDTLMLPPAAGRYGGEGSDPRELVRLSASKAQDLLQLWTAEAIAEGTFGTSEHWPHGLEETVEGRGQRASLWRSAELHGHQIGPMILMGARRPSEQELAELIGLRATAQQRREDPGLAALLEQLWPLEASQASPLSAAVVRAVARAWKLSATQLLGPSSMIGMRPGSSWTTEALNRSGELADGSTWWENWERRTRVRSSNMGDSPWPPGHPWNPDGAAGPITWALAWDCWSWVHGGWPYQPQHLQRAAEQGPSAPHDLCGTAAELAEQAREQLEGLALKAQGSGRSLRQDARLDELSSGMDGLKAKLEAALQQATSSAGRGQLRITQQGARIRFTANLCCWNDDQAGGFRGSLDMAAFLPPLRHGEAAAIIFG